MSQGKVSLVGAGPWDPGLITVAGLARLAEAEVVVYDRLINPKLLEQAPPQAERIYVGKEAGGHPIDQEGINALLVAKAREGKRVVRLKGGDPFIFGRGGEEAMALAAAGIPFEVVPGVTAAVAVPAYAGIPLTHRGVASSFLVATGHEDPAKGEPTLAWEKLATATDTLVFLMGTRSLPEIVGKLIKHGRSPQTPAAVIRWGTTPQQQTVEGTLADIVAKVQAAGLTAPTVLVVGEVVRLREALRWYEGRPLFGKRVLVTRARQQASALSRLLTEAGAEVIELPALEIRPTADAQQVEEALRRLAAGEYAWAVFTSANGVEVFFEGLRRSGGDARAFGGTRVCAIGPATAAALEACGLRADLVPEEYIAEGVVAALQGQLGPGQRVLLPRAEGARPLLVDGLRAQGIEVDEVTLYVAEAPPAVDAEALARVKRGEADIVTFASSSTVRNLVRLLGGDVEPLRQALVACIGPITAETARQQGFKVDIIAAEHTVPGLVRALVRYFPRGGDD